MAKPQISNSLMKKYIFLSLLFFSIFSFKLSAAEEGKNFNAGEMIMHHIADAHEIHLIGDFAIYLPVIISTDEGWEIFSSSHFYHNPQTVTTEDGGSVSYYQYKDFILYHEHIYQLENGLELSEEGEVLNHAVNLDLSITKSVAGMFLAIIILLLLFIPTAKAYRKRGISAPKGVQSFLEPLVLFVRDEIARPSIGHRADKFLPFLLTIFFFIWISNFLGLIPFIGGFNITGTLSITLVLAAIVFVYTSISGNKHYWGHILWPPGVPFFVKIILVPIEFLGIFIKPAVLMVRLTANITAGHIILLAFVALIFIFGQDSAGAGYGVGVGSVVFMVFMFFIELLVAFLQAYVFTLLSALYFGSAVEETH